VIGSYRVVGTLGKGGMGTVYVAEHTLLGRKAAIKVLLPELSVRKDIVSRFFNEARAATSINDPGIVQVFDFGYHGDASAYIVMEFLEGETLASRLRASGRLAPAAAMRIARQIAASLGAAHGKRIVHRDLKPENVFMVADAEAAGGERAKLLDFGIAKLADDHPDKVETTTGAIMGTPAYMSPEQCRGAGVVDHRADIYALGCVVFRMITGRLPFEADGAGDLIAMHLRETPRKPSLLASGIAPELDELVLRCLQKLPPNRFQTMHAVIAAIAALPPLSEVAPPSPPTPAGDALTADAVMSTITTHRPPPPTTLGSSAGSRAASRPARHRRWLGLALAAGAATAAYLALRGGGDRYDVASAPIDAASSGAIPDGAGTFDANPGGSIDAAVDDAATELAPLDARVPVALPPDAAVPRRSVPARRVQSDAAPPPSDPLDLDGDGLPDIRR